MKRLSLTSTVDPSPSDAGWGKSIRCWDTARRSPRSARRDYWSYRVFHVFSGFRVVRSGNEGRRKA